MLSLHDPITVASPLLAFRIIIFGMLLFVNVPTLIGLPVIGSHLCHVSETDEIHQ